MRDRKARWRVFFAALGVCAGAAIVRGIGSVLLATAASEASAAGTLAWASYQLLAVGLTVVPAAAAAVISSLGPGGRVHGMRDAEVVGYSQIAIWTLLTWKVADVAWPGAGWLSAFAGASASVLLVRAVSRLLGGSDRTAPAPR
jgi:hypothetical protein